MLEKPKLGHRHDWDVGLDDDEEVLVADAAVGEGDIRRTDAGTHVTYDAFDPWGVTICCMWWSAGGLGGACK